MQYPSPRPVIPFEQWLDAKYLFDWKSVDENLAKEREHFETRNTYAEYVVRTWEDPKRWLLDRLPLEAIGKTLQHEGHVYVNNLLPRELRDRAWQALSVLFKELFEPHTSGKLGHKNERLTDLDIACYMWWEQSPYFPGSPAVTEQDNKFFLGICDQCLRSPNASLQESALHGLGHSIGITNPLLASRDLINAFLKENRAARKELISYAKRAGRGRVL